MQPWEDEEGKSCAIDHGVEGKHPYDDDVDDDDDDDDEDGDGDDDDDDNDDDDDDDAGWGLWHAHTGIQQTAANVERGTFPGATFSSSKSILYYLFISVIDNWISVLIIPDNKEI